MRVLAGFFISLAAIFTFPLFVFMIGREGFTVERALRIQVEHPDAIFGRAFSSELEHYKFVAASEIKPEVFALGTSRMMQVQAHHFKSGARFYNGSQGGLHFDTMRIYLSALEPSEPKVLILALDHYFFHPDQGYKKLYFEDAKQFETYLKSDNSGLHSFQTAWTKIYRSSMDHTVSVKELWKRARVSESIGIAAVLRESGFRFDGSYQYEAREATGPFDPLNPDFKFKTTLKYFEDRNGRLEPGDAPSEKSLGEFKDFLAFCKERKIHVVCFLTPFPHAIWSRLEGSGRYGYMTSLGAQLSPICAGAGVAFEDFSDMAAFGAPDSDSINGGHANAKTYGIILKRLGEIDPQLASYLAH